MLYVIQHGYNGVRRVAPEQIVYCILRIEDILKSDKECIFTNGHALSILTEYYPKNKLVNINSIINYDDVYSSRWDSATDLDLKRRKEAELLIKTDLEPSFIRGYVVYNSEAKRKLESFGVDESKIIIKSNFYF